MLHLFCVRQSGARLPLRFQALISNSRVHIRRKATDTKSAPLNSIRRSNPNTSQNALRSPIRTPQLRPQAALGKARGKPKQVVIYHAGTGKIAFIGMMRLTTILIFVVSCSVVAPAFFVADHVPWYISPAIVIGGAIPMLFVSYTAAPFVNQIYLSLPAFAQQSTQRMQSYLANVPRSAVLSVETMKFNFYPRRTQAVIADLTPKAAIARPVSFMHTNPQPQPWWKGQEQVLFFTPEKNRPMKATSKFYPEIWEQVFSLIKNNPISMKRT